MTAEHAFQQPLLEDVDGGADARDLARAQQQQAVAQLGASVTVIGEDELKTYNYSEFQEVMRQVPGVDIQRFGGLGRNSSIRIRGANPNQVQVLVDGMRVKSPTLGSAELSEISLDAIERIEVVRGPQSTLYGADAIGGVVNVITKKGAGPVQSP